jgi:hypothetical protein
MWNVEAGVRKEYISFGFRVSSFRIVSLLNRVLGCIRTEVEASGGWKCAEMRGGHRGGSGFEFRVSSSEFRVMAAAEPVFGWNGFLSWIRLDLRSFGWDQREGVQRE